MNTRYKKRLLILFLSVLVTGCNLDFKLPVNEKMRLSVYEGKQPVLERELENSDPTVQAIDRWLAANPQGWDYAFITRDPHIYLAGKNFSVNIAQSEVSVKYCRASYNCHFWIKKDSELFLQLKELAKTH